MPIVFHNGKLLFTADGRLAMSEDCCCCLDEPVTKVVTASYTMYPTPRFSATLSEIAAMQLSPVNLISFSGGGATHGPADRGQTKTWNDDNCPVGVGKLPFVQCERTMTGDPNKDEGYVQMDFTFTVYVARQGTSEILFWPSLAAGCVKPTERVCEDGDLKWLWYATEFQYSLDGNAPTTVYTGWNATTRTYTAARPHTITIRIP